jgi:hypothetical protein
MSNKKRTKIKTNWNVINNITKIKLRKKKEQNERWARFTAEWNKEIRQLRIEMGRCIKCDIDIPFSKFKMCLCCRIKAREYGK